jgi:hypothetical protein
MMCTIFYAIRYATDLYLQWIHIKENEVLKKQ